MKRGLIIISSLLALILSACSPDNQQGGGREGVQTNYEPMYRDHDNDTRIGYVRNDQINGDEAARGGGQNEIGYFRYRPENYANEGRAAGPDVFIDRTLLARHIAQLVTVLPNVQEATALVTDDHVFVGVATKNKKLDPKTVKEARRTAESVTPRYYRIHVTTDKNLNSQIQSVGMRMAGNSDVQGVRGDLEQLIREMGDETPPDLNENNQPNSLRDINPNQD